MRKFLRTNAAVPNDSNKYWLEEEEDGKECNVKTWIWNEIEEPGENFSTADIRLCRPLTRSHLEALKLMNSTSLPVHYDARYYNSFLCKDGEDSFPCWSKLAYFHDILIGAICCKVEFDELEEEPAIPPVVTKKTRIDQFFTPLPKNMGNKCNSKPLGTARSARLHLQTLACHSQFRRHGVGSLLLEEMLRFCKSVGSSANSLTNFASIKAENVAAIALYRKFGFEVTDKLPNYYRRIESPDALQMEYILL